MTDDRLFLSWSIRREYEPREIEEAELFLLGIHNVFEPAGEEFGVVYLPEVEGPAESTNRIGPLILQCSRFRGNAFCKSIADETLVAPEMQTLILNNAFTGAEFGPIICKGQEASKRGWAELIISPRVSISPRTLIGVDPLELGPSGGTGLGANIGLNVLSEVAIIRETWDGSDFAVSEQTVGTHQGLLRPRRLLMVSKRVLQAMSPKMRRGLAFEIIRFR
ncbi:MAG: hypothetical protein QOF71_1371 [Candidatus Eremiobacteraeota bacterium]|jgi:hypothetical protein|nr:hypothetical protein [Candidatus Eremiobacteraeota bacterium]